MGGRGQSSSTPMSDAEFAEAARDFTYDAAGYRSPELLDADGRRAVERFDRALDGRSYGGDVSRGVRLTERQLSDVHVGDVVDQRGISSWTSDDGEAVRFAQEARRDYGDGVPVVFVMEGGTSHGADISGYSSRRTEGEVAISSKSRQVVTRIEMPEYDERWDYYLDVARIYVKEAR